MERDPGGGVSPSPRSGTSAPGSSRWWSSIVTRSQPTGRPISLFIDIGQGAGLAGATGVRPFLPPLLAGALARANAGIDFDDGSFSFLESPWFLLGVLALAAAAYAVERRGGSAPAARADVLLLGAAIALGGLLFAGSLSEGGHSAWAGLAAGAGCAALSFACAARLLSRARRRLAGQPGGYLAAYADGISLALAAISVVLPPAGYLLLAWFILLLMRVRDAAAGKYEGLRILR